ncbi:hypothetical protein ISN44_As10g011190 [Arabidopsis suecica]|uniref:Uncharacterized protein n=1 Tax=Arabidopsis suecica TaxID=45249 RepID=A0A8T1ZUE3_ARASU|nr:hypothetical protein ISN44_As10g011190 [Arabidopsis suecica]
MVKITVCVLVPHADYCLPGKTRATVMELVAKENFILEESVSPNSIELMRFFQVWTARTMAELSSGRGSAKPL